MPVWGFEPEQEDDGLAPPVSNADCLKCGAELDGGDGHKSWCPDKGEWKD